MERLFKIEAVNSKKLEGRLMNVWSEWKDSLSLLYPANLKLFLLVALNALRQAFIIWLQHFWMLIGLVLFCLVLERSGGIGVLRLAAITVGSFALLVEFILAMRPSVGLKNYTYFNHYFSHLIACIALLYGTAGLYSVFMRKNAFVFNGMLAVFIAVMTVLAAMFFLDGKASIKNLLGSLYRALKMFFYNLPFICVSVVVGYLLFCMLFYGMSALIFRVVDTTLYPTFYNYFFLLLSILFFFCVTSVGICFFGNLYVKKSQEQYTLYFDK